MSNEAEENDTKTRDGPRYLRRLVLRVRSACRTNEPQAMSVVMLTPMMLLAAVSGEASWWIVVAATLLFPGIAFCGNLVDPIPPKDNSQND